MHQGTPENILHSTSRADRGNLAIGATSDRVMRLPEVMDRVGLRRSSIYLQMNQGSFPKPIAIGYRAVGWLEHEINEWLAKRISARSRTEANQTRSLNGSMR